MISKLADIALSQVGQREEGNNSGPAVRKYQSATDLEPGEWRWCAAFVCWCLHEWLAQPGVLEWLGLKGTAEDWRPKTALAFGMLEWARNRPLTTKILPATEKPQAGDLAVFRFSHIIQIRQANWPTSTATGFPSPKSPTGN